MGWVSPTGFVDPSVDWKNEENAYDDDTVSYAQSKAVGSYLELTLNAINCDKIQIWAEDNGANPDVAIDVYYDAGWNNIFSGAITQGEWVEKAIGSTESVTAARVKANSIADNLNLFEFDFNEAAAVALEINVSECVDLDEKL